MTKAVRMLSSDEIDKIVRDSAMAEDSARYLIKRSAYKVLEVNGLMPLAQSSETAGIEGIDWGEVDAELLSILQRALVYSDGGARDQKVIGDLRALLRKVSGQ